MRQYTAIIFLLLCIFGGVAVGDPREPKKPAEPQSELAQAPVAARSWRNPYEGRPQAVLAGKQIFDRYCAQCHGADGKGRGKAPDISGSTVEKTAPGTLFWFLKNGNLKDGMPAWSHLPDQQLWQLVSFLQSGIDHSPPRVDK